MSSPTMSSEAVLTVESGAPISAQQTLARGLRAYVDGEFPVPDSTMPTLDPSSGLVLAEVPVSSPEEVDRAVRAANAAFRGWADTSASARAKLLWRLADLIEANAVELAALDVLDNGKPLAEAEAVDVALAQELYRYFAACAATSEGAVLPNSGPGMLALSLNEPVGVVAAITPWNFPLLETSYKLGPALAAGCTIVLKPSELAPLSTLRLMELVAEAGFPRGVANVVLGGPEVGEALIRHPLVRKVAFTGQTETGKAITRSAADDLKSVSLDLGGKSPNIVFADADLEAAAAGVFGGVFFNQGEACVAGSRLLVQESVADELVAEVVRRAGSVTLGNGFAATTTMGPLISERHRSRVAGMVDAAVQGGAEVVAGGSFATVEDHPGGYFFSPTVLTGVTNDMSIAQEEVFGPVLSVITWRDEEELVRLANDSPFAMAAGIWTASTTRALRLARLLDAGTVWVNTYGMFDAAVPFGGRKQSGGGRELGREAFSSYRVTKSVWVDLGAVPPSSDGQSIQQ